MAVACVFNLGYLPLIIIVAFFLAVSLCLMSHFWYSMWRTPNTSESLRYYYLAIIVSNSFLCFHIIVNLAQAISFGTCDYEMYLFCAHFFAPSYYYGITLLLWIFIKRLKHVVDGTLFELSKCVYVYFQIIVVALICISPAIAAWIYIPDLTIGGHISLLVGATCITTYFVNSIFAMRLFINKLGQIIGLMAHGDITQRQKKQRLQSTQKIVRRQTLLITIALSSTMCIIVINIVWFHVFFWDRLEYNYIAVWQCIDCIIGIICINVQFKHGEQFYKNCRLDKLETKIDKWILCFNKKITLNENMTKSINDTQNKRDVRSDSGVVQPVNKHGDVAQHNLDVDVGSDAIELNSTKI